MRSRQTLYVHPATLLIWVAGLAWSFFREGRSYRVFAWSFCFMFAALLVTHAKPYYLARAYPVSFAAGGVAVERKIGQRSARRAGLLAPLITTGMGFGIIALPVLPRQQCDAVLDTSFGRVVPPVGSVTTCTTSTDGRS